VATIGPSEVRATSDSQGQRTHQGFCFNFLVGGEGKKKSLPSVNAVRLSENFRKKFNYLGLYRLYRLYIAENILNMEKFD
jgi:hypothetical protein